MSRWLTPLHLTERMRMDPEPRLMLVDDDASVLRGLERLLRVNGFRVEAFASATDFLERARLEEPTCLILDLSLPGPTGLDLQETLSRTTAPVAVIFLSGQADVPAAARAMRQGAVDFLIKPVDERQLLDAVTRAQTHANEMYRRRIEELDRARRLARLTKREREVCELVARGLLNKQIASELGTSEKTVKVHRGRMMHKLQVSSVAELVRLFDSGSSRS